MAARKNTPRKEVVNARVDVDALAKLDALAETDRRSRSELVDFAVQEYVARHAPKSKPAKDQPAK